MYFNVPMKIEQYLNQNVRTVVGQFAYSATPPSMKCDQTLNAICVGRTNRWTNTQNEVTKASSFSNGHFELQSGPLNLNCNISIIYDLYDFFKVCKTNSPTVTWVVSSRVKYSTTGPETYPEPRSRTRFIPVFFMI